MQNKFIEIKTKDNRDILAIFDYEKNKFEVFESVAVPDGECISYDLVAIGSVEV